MKSIRLRAGRERSLLRRHPWVFEGSIERGRADAGETVRIEDATTAQTPAARRKLRRDTDRSDECALAPAGVTLVDRPHRLLARHTVHDLDHYATGLLLVITAKVVKSDLPVAA